MNNYSSKLYFYKAKRIVQSQESKTKQLLLDMERKNKQLKSQVDELNKRLDQKNFGEKKQAEINTSIQKDMILQNI